jgi:hypothetical protein
MQLHHLLLSATAMNLLPVSEWPMGTPKVSTRRFPLPGWLSPLLPPDEFASSIDNQGEPPNRGKAS